MTFDEVVDRIATRAIMPDRTPPGPPNPATAIVRLFLADWHALLAAHKEEVTLLTELGRAEGEKDTKPSRRRHCDWCGEELVCPEGCKP